MTATTTIHRMTFFIVPSIGKNASTTPTMSSRTTSPIKSIASSKTARMRRSAGGRLCGRAHNAAPCRSLLRVPCLQVPVNRKARSRGRLSFCRALGVATARGLNLPQVRGQSRRAMTPRVNFSGLSGYLPRIPAKHRLFPASPLKADATQGDGRRSSLRFN